MKPNAVKFIATTVSGNIMEWYDFALYGYFATIIGKLFFPSKDQFFSLLFTFSAFATGFLTRILGSFFFGHLGDRYGRRKSLLVSISLIILPTFAIGLLPTYASIGHWSPILLVACRLLQGGAII